MKGEIMVQAGKIINAKVLKWEGTWRVQGNENMASTVGV